MGPLDREEDRGLVLESTLQMSCARRVLCLGVCVLALIPDSAHADRIFWGCLYRGPQVLRSGQITCRQDVQQCKTMTLSCSRGSEALFTMADFADYVAASDDGRYIVGLSNRGSVNAF